MQPNQNLGIATMLQPIAVAANANSLILDLTDADGADILISVGAVTGSPDGSNKLDITVQDSPDGVGANFAAVPVGTDATPNRMNRAEDGTVQSPTFALDAAGSFGKTYRLGVRQFAGRPKVRINFVKTGTVSAPISIQAVVAYRKAPSQTVVVGVAAT